MWRKVQKAESKDERAGGSYLVFIRMVHAEVYDEHRAAVVVAILSHGNRDGGGFHAKDLGVRLRRQPEATVHYWGCGAIHVRQGCIEDRAQGD